MIQQKTNRVGTMTLAAILTALAGASMAEAKTFYVNVNNPALGGDGGSWANAALRRP